MTVSYEDKLVAECVVQDTLDKLGCPLVIQVEWAALKSAAGLANYSKRLIRLSTIAWAHMDEAQRHNTAVHEACHIVSDYDAGYRVKPHGREWKNLMIRSGANPER